jgi:hypothetical protein
MGTVQALPDRGSGVRLDVAVVAFLGTVTVANTRRAYAASATTTLPPKSRFGLSDGGTP